MCNVFNHVNQAANLTIVLNTETLHHLKDDKNNVILKYSHHIIKKQFRCYDAGFEIKSLHSYDPLASMKIPSSKYK